MKKILKKLFNFLGIEIHRVKKKSMKRGWNSKYISWVASPKTVIDIGVGDNGTPVLYEAFPNSKIVLIDPIINFYDVKTKLKHILKKYNTEIISKALSNNPGYKKFLIDKNKVTKSSFESRTELTKTNSEIIEKNVEVTTLDKINNEYPDLKEPILIKIDTEGHELKVLQGAYELLKRTDVIIAEVSVAKRFESGYGFYDLVRFMYSNDFHLFDILSTTPIKGKPGLQYMDIVFKRVIK